jgi:murein DD-endopeptidase MepM/ murein hydrolase activator NlpD/urea transporter
LLQALLRPYAQVLLSRSLLAGVFVAAAIAVRPALFLLTLLALALAALVTALLGLGLETVRNGGAGCMAVLTTLALPAFAPPGGSPIPLVVLGTVFAVLFFAAFQAVCSSFSLPAHALPFVAATWIVHLAARMMPAGESFADFFLPCPNLPAWTQASSWLDLPAILVFGHGRLTGVFVLLAIAVHSRIALLLAALGAVSALGVQHGFRPGVPTSTVDTIAGFNAMLAAMAIGGLWFVPQPSAIVLSGAAGVIAAVTSYALCSVLAPFALPVISLPFVLTVLLLLATARLREHDRWPRSAVPASHPEEVLARHLTHLRRFGNLPWLPFRLPFRGEWFVSQGHDGAHTHRGLWRHGLDFEGAGPDGKPYRGAGNELREFICYGLPVVAAGAGTVALVEDGVVDNRIGEINVHDNWGNGVVICHGAALFSVYAHLQAKSIKVKVGDVVTPGMEIGRCGNSGRSPTPHLHFQVQRAKHLGSPTIAFDFGDVIVRRDGVSEMGTHLVPGQGSSVRPIQRDESLARLFSFPPGTSYALRAEPGGTTEIARVEIDLRGARYLQSSRGKLYFDTYENGLVLTSYTGAPGSLLRFLLLAAARVPFDSAAELTWTDSLSRRLLLRRVLRGLSDLLSVVLPDVGRIDVVYRMKREAGRVNLQGFSAHWTAQSSLDLDGGEHTIEVIHRGTKTTVTMRQAKREGMA